MLNNKDDLPLKDGPINQVTDPSGRFTEILFKDATGFPIGLVFTTFLHKLSNLIFILFTIQ